MNMPRIRAHHMVDLEFPPTFTVYVQVRGTIQTKKSSLDIS